MAKQDGGTVLRTSLAVGLIGLGLVAAVMEVQADLTPLETRRAAHRLQFDTRWRVHVGTVDQALARQAYLNALIRAHRDGALDGLRRTAAAFEALGDHAVATHCRRVADELAANRKGL
jgi:hypothetical protein